VLGGASTPVRSRKHADLTAEEHQRRGDAAEAPFREIVRRATGVDQR